jgi:hypothetical protein
MMARLCRWLLHFKQKRKNEKKSGWCLPLFKQKERNTIKKKKNAKKGGSLPFLSSSS